PGVSLTGACPSNAGIVDRVGYGSANCTADWGGNTTVLTSTTSLFRNNDGCVKSGATSDDFTAGAVQPRNSASPRKNCVQPPRPASSATLVISELMRDPVNAESMSWGQWFEVHNYGTTPIDLNGWTIISAGSNQPDHVVSSSVVVAPGMYAVLGRGADQARNGGVALDYNYFTGTSNTIWLDASDFLMLVDGEGARADSVAWTSLPRGVSVALRDPALPHTDVASSAWGFSTSTYGDGDFGTPGTANTPLADVPPFVSANRISFSGRTAADAPIPVGFEAQVFASLRDAAGIVIETQFTFEALTPSVASIDPRGVVRALSAGEARFLATATDGTARIHSLIMETPSASTTAQYGNHAEFGEPVDGDASDDFVIRRPQFITSWNGARGIPNWVAYNLNATQIAGGQDRCNCFTFDPELEAAGFQRYNTADYTGAGAYHKYGIDRGHLVRSFDRTSGSLDNARTYYFSNIIPQAADVNQGPWAVMENHLGDLARSQNKEVFIYAGASGAIGTIKDEGRIVIPKDNWKVAVVLPRGMGLADVRDYRDVQVIAAVMPNVPGVRNVNWQTAYQVTADSVERLSGYSFLTALPSKIQRALKTGTMPPIGLVDGPYAAAEGSELTVSAAGAVDPNGTIVSYEWNFGDGTTATGVAPTHTYALTGNYTVRLVVTDNDGLVDTVATTAQVRRIDAEVGLENLEALINGLVSGTINRGEANSLMVKVNAARNQLARDNVNAFVNQIEALIREVEAMGRSGRLSAATVERIRFEAERLNRAVVAAQAA
ncbi:MAG: DNA/RNA non-specific endonuclease, partial [Gemmatimonadaceae bacterium]|nr:DNA/RNA non-specific endonuclease [Gemmatimonadaceae bacterium]